MAKRIEIQKADGSKDVYNSGLLRGYHKHEGSDGVCITSKPLFGKETVVQCYPKAQVTNSREERCGVCETINPTQTSDYKK